MCTCMYMCVHAHVCVCVCMWLNRLAAPGESHKFCEAKLFSSFRPFRFLLEFCLPAAERGIASLSVVETNPFRHLNHLSLKFAPATDSHLKKYLADCLLGLKVYIQHCMVIVLQALILGESALGCCGVVVAQWSERRQLWSEALGSIPSGCPSIFSVSILIYHHLLTTSSYCQLL